jgi:hypothetical protein
VNDDGLLELKCPKTATHLGYLRDPSSLAAAYKAQLTHALWVSGRDYIDIVSFDDRLPERLQFVGARFEVTAEYLAEHEAAVRTFLDEVDREMRLLGHLLGYGVMEAK